ncbi:zinc ribbon domain-containing protein [Candidatus Aenigmatarchaeota archaeon]
MKCAKCKSKNIDEGKLSFGIYPLKYTSDKLSFFGSPTSKPRTIICLDCGYMELYWDNIEKLTKKLKK